MNELVEKMAIFHQKEICPEIPLTKLLEVGNNAFDKAEDEYDGDSRGFKTFAQVAVKGAMLQAIRDFKKTQEEMFQEDEKPSEKPPEERKKRKYTKKSAFWEGKDAKKEEKEHSSSEKTPPLEEGKAPEEDVVTSVTAPVFSINGILHFLGKKYKVNFALDEVIYENK